MIQSMTGFTRISHDSSKGEFVWELKTVNHRYMECQFRLPEGFRSLETKARNLVKQRLLRGKLDARLMFRAPDSGDTTVELNQPLLTQLLALGEEVAGRQSVQPNWDMARLLSWPDLVRVSKVEVDDALLDGAMLSFEKAIAKLKTERETEGNALGEVILDKTASLEQALSSLTENYSSHLASRTTALKEQVAKLGETVDAARLAQEIALLMVRHDISEELERLAAHLDAVRAKLKGEGPMGRELDFLTQELNRESNTIASKAANKETVQIALQMKVWVDQIREQVQNIV